MFVCSWFPIASFWGSSTYERTVPCQYINICFHGMLFILSLRIRGLLSCKNNVILIKPPPTAIPKNQKVEDHRGSSNNRDKPAKRNTSQHAVIDPSYLMTLSLSLLIQYISQHHWALSPYAVHSLIPLITQRDQGEPDQCRINNSASHNSKTKHFKVGGDGSFV